MLKVLEKDLETHEKVLQGDELSAYLVERNQKVQNENLLSQI